VDPSVKRFWTPEALARQGIRGIDAFTAEELAQLQRKLEAWIRQRAPQTGSTRRRPPFFKKPKPATPP
jgi:hypothetical protein